MRSAIRGLLWRAELALVGGLVLWGYASMVWGAARWVAEALS